MGYLLPIQPITSQQYANRMNMEPYDFAVIGRVEKVNRTVDVPVVRHCDGLLTQRGHAIDEFVDVAGAV